MNKKHHISSDFNKNPELKNDLGEVRGSIVENANKVPIPERFQVTPDESLPKMWIKDTTTGNEVAVGIFAYAEVRRVLNALFPEEPKSNPSNVNPYRDPTGQDSFDGFGD